ncbi:hypothetical protein UF16_16265 [Chromobacterium violaceum]|nr:hypothetical protein UF16_16265 [Chromobacterium violaceum]
MADQHGQVMERILGCNGERLDSVGGGYGLGHGYRTYDPALMRFQGPDSQSPFGAGGINPYAYCSGDPVNRSDPSGHLSWQGWSGIGLGVAGLALAAFTAGSSIAAAGGAIAALESASAASLLVAGAAVVADATAIASGATEALDPKASVVLGWVSLATGMAGAVYGVAGLARTLHKSSVSLHLAQRGMAALVEQASSDAALSWGRNIENYKVLGIVTGDNALVVTFEDTYRGARRFNVLAHGGMRDRVGLMLFEDADGGVDLYSGSQFADMLRDTGAVPDFGRYRYARTVVCRSAEGDGVRNLSFAGSFAERSGLPTKGFVGAVSTSGFFDRVLARFAQVEQRYMHFSLQDLENEMAAYNNAYTDKQVFRILKRGDGRPYFPVKFPAPNRPYP